MEERSPSSSPIHLPQGFSFSAACAGIKVSGKPDLAFAEAAPDTTAAAIFTRNRVVAAPLIVARASLAKTGGKVRALVVNSGNANCATGKPGLLACREVCRETAGILGAKSDEVFSSSTGIIGVPLPTAKILAKLPELLATQQATVDAVRGFAAAIMTTDTRPKLASVSVPVGGKQFSLLGIAKGAGMIHPQMATMLVYLFTDVAAPAPVLRRLLRQACDQTFNCISVDGDTSTNDTALLLASGKSGVYLANSSARKKFTSALLSVSQSLAEQIVRDGEGVQHVVRLSVQQAQSREEALRVAKAVGHSLLVKTAWAGADPNWGRILAAIGASGVPIRPEKIEIMIGDQVVFRGTATTFDESRAHKVLSQPSCDVQINLGRGRHGVTFLTTDLTAEYVHINADYST